MIYKVYMTDGQRLTLEADRVEQDGSGTRLYKDDGGLIAGFYCGEVARVFPETAIEEATVV